MLKLQLKKNVWNDVSLGSKTDQTNIYHTIGSHNEWKEEKKLKIQPNQYYDVACNGKCDWQGSYIRRVVDFPDKNPVCIKYLHCLSLAWLAPKRLNLQNW